MRRILRVEAVVGLLLAGVGVLCADSVAGPASPIMPGTIIPARLDRTIDPEEAKPGDAIEAYVAQDVPLGKHTKLKRKSVLSGQVVSVSKDGEEAVVLSIKFDKFEYEKQTYPMVTSLRAIASWQAVHDAQIGFGGADSGTPAGWAATTQIGGDIRYGDGGEVRNVLKQKVGKGVIGGVLVEARADPGSPCEGELHGDKSLQAMWVFSAAACGPFDLKGMKITHNGLAEPKGTITLRFEKHGMKLDANDGILLRVLQ